MAAFIPSAICWEVSLPLYGLSSLFGDIVLTWRLTDAS
jgi:hypothetical protein